MFAYEKDGKPCLGDSGPLAKLKDLMQWPEIQAKHRAEQVVRTLQDVDGSVIAARRKLLPEMYGSAPKCTRPRFSAFDYDGGDEIAACSGKGCKSDSEASITGCDTVLPPVFRPPNPAAVQHHAYDEYDE